MFDHTVTIRIPDTQLPANQQVAQTFLFSSYPEEAKQLLNGFWLIPPSKCRQNKFPSGENCVNGSVATEQFLPVSAAGRAWQWMAGQSLPASQVDFSTATFLNSCCRIFNTCFISSNFDAKSLQSQRMSRSAPALLC